ncbi:unnamed protein product [Gordionus sp. m RMFG-2023]|uniref:uncharacterized protein LOC135923662 n=1 Tax=Gordionus sp. m RMFG-2023 TaxID=3053472 RepID=UPI0030DEB37C
MDYRSTYYGLPQSTWTANSRGILGSSPNQMNYYQNYNNNNILPTNCLLNNNNLVPTAMSGYSNSQNNWYNSYQNQQMDVNSMSNLNNNVGRPRDPRINRNYTSGNNITRLEEIDMSRITMCRGNDAVPYETDVRRELRIADSPHRSKKIRKPNHNSDNEVEYWDPFCWICHMLLSSYNATTIMENDPLQDNLNCHICQRSFHRRCLNTADILSLESSCHFDAQLCVITFACPECQKIAEAESSTRGAENRQKVQQKFSRERLNKLLYYAFNRTRRIFLTGKGSKYIEYFPMDPDYVVKPMNFNNIESNIQLRSYSSPQSLISDIKYLYHNTAIFYGKKESRSTPEINNMLSTLKLVEKVCKEEVSEIEACSECYYNAHTLPFSEWFSAVCGSLHTLVWGKMKGYPFWPGKVVRIHQANSNDSTNSNTESNTLPSSIPNANNIKLDVRFFGKHDKSWLPLQSCFILSRRPPSGPMNTGIPSRLRKEYDEALNELDTHITNLEKKFGVCFPYAEDNTLFSIENPNVSNNNRSKYDINQTLKFLYYQFKTSLNVIHNNKKRKSSDSPYSNSNSQKYNKKLSIKHAKTDVYKSSHFKIAKVESASSTHVKSKVYKVDSLQSSTHELSSTSDYSKIKSRPKDKCADIPRNTLIAKEKDIVNSKQETQHSCINKDLQIALNLEEDVKNNGITCQNESDKNVGAKSENPAIVKDIPEEVGNSIAIAKPCAHSLSNIIDQMIQNIKSVKTSLSSNNLDANHIAPEINSLSSSNCVILNDTEDGLNSNDHLLNEPQVSPNSYDDHIGSFAKIDMSNIELNKRLVIQLSPLQMSQYKDLSHVIYNEDRDNLHSQNVEIAVPKEDQVLTNNDSPLFEGAIENFQNIDDFDAYAYDLIETNNAGTNDLMLNLNDSKENEILEDISDDDLDATIIRESKSGKAIKEAKDDLVKSHLEIDDSSVFNRIEEGTYNDERFSEEDIMKALEHKRETIIKDIQECLTEYQYETDFLSRSQELTSEVKGNDNYDKIEAERDLFPRSEGPLNITNLKSGELRKDDTGAKIIEAIYQESEGTDIFIESVSKNHDIQVCRDLQSNISSDITILSIPGLNFKTSDRNKGNDLLREINDKTLNLLKEDSVTKVDYIEQEGILTEIIDVEEIERLSPKFIEDYSTKVIINCNVFKDPLANDIYNIDVSNVLNSVDSNILGESLATENNEKVSKDNEDEGIIQTSTLKSYDISEESGNEKSLILSPLNYCKQFLNINNSSLIFKDRSLLNSPLDKNNCIDDNHNKIDTICLSPTSEANTYQTNTNQILMDGVSNIEDIVVINTVQSYNFLTQDIIKNDTLTATDSSLNQAQYTVPSSLVYNSGITSGNDNTVNDYGEDSSDIQILDVIIDNISSFLTKSPSSGLDELNLLRRKPKCIAKKEILSDDQLIKYNKQNLINNDVECSIDAIDIPGELFNQNLPSNLKNSMDKQSEHSDSEAASNQLNLESLLKTIELRIKGYIKEQMNLKDKDGLLATGDTPITPIANLKIKDVLAATDDKSIIPIPNLNLLRDNIGHKNPIVTPMNNENHFDIVIPAEPIINANCIQIPSTSEDDPMNMIKVNGKRDKKKYLDKKALKEIMINIHSHYKTQLEDANKEFNYRHTSLKLHFELEKDDLKSIFTEQISALQNQIIENKKKQWCVSCFKQAFSYCCIGVWYCSVHCQRNNWPLHKENCVEYKNKVVATPVNPNNIFHNYKNLSNPNTSSFNNNNVIRTGNFNNRLPYLHQNSIPQIYSNTTPSYYNNIDTNNNTNVSSMIHYPSNIRGRQNMTSRMLFPPCVQNSNILGSSIPYISTNSNPQIRRYLEKENTNHLLNIPNFNTMNSDKHKESHTYFSPPTKMPRLNN